MLHLTHDLPGIGGVLRQEPADFDVTEIPAYEPCGSGDHLYLWIEKTGLGAEYFVQQLARRLRMNDRDIGVAGLKDRHAVTRQWISVPANVEANLPAIDGDGVKLLNVTRHTNKLRTGHLKGNRFRILIRNVEQSDTTKANVAAILGRIQTQGLPNFYGPQRFGRDGDTAAMGFRLLRGERIGRVPPFKLKLYLSAVQSQLFNECLEQRIQDGLFRTVMAGDVMMKWPAGGLFVAEDVPTEQTRFDARETVMGGPMFGTSLFASKGEVFDREAKVLAANNLTPESFGGFGKLLGGTRRHNVVYVDDLAAAWEPDGLRMTFTLPSGSYATVLLGEVMKEEVTDSPLPASGRGVGGEGESPG
ncbi:tRNA pseudouridine(13) synthase TruD [soil metagenome]